MKFPYKVKIGDRIIPAWTEISEEALGVVKATAPDVSAKPVVEVQKEPTEIRIPFTDTVEKTEKPKRGRQKK